MCCAESIAAWKLAKLTTPRHLGARQRRELQGQAAREGERAFGAHEQVREVDAAVAVYGLRFADGKMSRL
jgi:hypothetical protein